MTSPFFDALILLMSATGAYAGIAGYILARQTVRVADAARAESKRKTVLGLADLYTRVSSLEKKNREFQNNAPTCSRCKKSLARCVEKENGDMVCVNCER